MQREDARECVATGWGKAQTVSIVYDLIGANGGYSSERRRNAGESERRDIGEGDPNRLYAYINEGRTRERTRTFLLFL